MAPAEVSSVVPLSRRPCSRTAARWRPKTGSGTAAIACQRDDWLFEIPRSLKRGGTSGRSLRPSSSRITAILFWQSGQQFAQLAFGAQSDLGRIVLRLKAESSLSSIDSGSLGEVVDSFCVVHAADLGEQPPRGLQPGQ